MTICLLGDEPPKTHAVVQHEQISSIGEIMSFAFKFHALQNRATRNQSALNQRRYVCC